MKQIITASIEKDVFYQVETQRGDISRSKFVEKAIRSYLQDLIRRGYQ